jgi:hypothetical protein
MVNLIISGLIANAIIGALVFNWAWKQLMPIIKSDETVDAKYPSFRRLDVKKWDKFKFFLGAVTVMPIRFLIGILILLSLFIFVK